MFANILSRVETMSRRRGVFASSCNSKHRKAHEANIMEKIPPLIPLFTSFCPMSSKGIYIVHEKYVEKNRSQLNRRPNPLGRLSPQIRSQQSATTDAFLAQNERRRTSLKKTVSLTALTASQSSEASHVSQSSHSFYTSSETAVRPPRQAHSILQDPALKSHTAWAKLVNIEIVIPNYSPSSSVSCSRSSGIAVLG